MGIEGDIRDFLSARAAERADAGQRAALQIVCGLDLAAALGGDEASRRQALHRVDRMVRRERVRGVSRHWAYDLNRHIALKQASDRLRRSLTNHRALATEPISRGKDG